MQRRAEEIVRYSILAVLLGLVLTGTSHGTDLEDQSNPASQVNCLGF